MNFFKKVQSSVYSPEFYKQVPMTSFGSALGYFLLLALFMAVIRSAIPVWEFVTVGQKEVDKFTTQALNVYPSELELKIQDGKVSTNVQEPYYVSIPSGIDEGEDSQYLAVIDTKTPFSAAQFNAYNTLAWVTEDSVFVKGDSQFRTIDLTEAENFTLNKSVVDSFAAKAAPWLKLVLPVVVIGIFLVMLLSNMFMLVSMLFTALIIWLILRLLNKGLSYADSYKVGMYALTLGFFLDALKEVMHFPGFPFMHTVITLVVVLVNFLPASKSPKSKR